MLQLPVSLECPHPNTVLANQEPSHFFINYRIRDINQDLAGGILTRILHALGQANNSNIIRDRTRIVVSVIKAVSRRHTQRAGLSDIQAVGSQLHIVSVSPGKCQY
jgi:hypothetical protein